MLIDLPNRYVVGYLTRIDKGLYLVDHWDAQRRLEQDFYEFFHEWPEYQVSTDERVKWMFDRIYSGLFFSTFGSCDCPEQFRDHPEYGKAIEAAVESFVVTFRHILKDGSGYRWHKNGPYIGEKRQGFEYLDDEPDINEIYQFAILRKK